MGCSVMSADADFPRHVAFTNSVKSVQTERGSVDPYARLAQRLGYQSATTEGLEDFLAVVDTAFLATASAEGLPYAQHRGGPVGFIRVLDEKTLGFADFAGNRQFISTGNLRENSHAFLILMDYAQQRRIKIWGTARVVRDDPELLVRLRLEDYRARIEQAILFTVDAWDINCPQHIPRKFNADRVTGVIDRLERRIETLEAENSSLRLVLEEMGRADEPQHS